MKEATKQQYDALIMAAREKLRYEAAMKEYRELSPMRKLFTRAPKDLTPGYSFARLTEILSDTFRRAHKDLNRHDPGLSGPYSYGKSFTVDVDRSGGLTAHVRTESMAGGKSGGGFFHEEFKEHRYGYGLVDQFTHDPDPKQDTLNRNYAASHAIASRDQDEMFVAFHKRVDDICFNEFRKTPSLGDPGLGQNPSYVRRLVDRAAADYAEEKKEIEKVAPFFRPVGEVLTLEDYVRETEKCDKINRAALSGKFETISDLVPMVLEYRHKLAIADHYFRAGTFMTDSFETEKMGAAISERIPQLPGRPVLADIVSYAESVSKMGNPSRLAANMAHTFGYQTKEIRTALYYDGWDDGGLDKMIAAGIDDAQKELSKEFKTVLSSDGYTGSKRPTVNVVSAAVTESLRNVTGRMSDEIAEYLKRQKDEKQISRPSLAYKVNRSVIDQNTQEKPAMDLKWQDGKVCISRHGDADLLVDGISAEKEGFHIVKKDGKFNYLGKDGELLCKNWLDKAGEFEGGIAECVIGKSFFEINTKGECITKKTLVQENVAKGMKI